MNLHKDLEAINKTFAKVTSSGGTEVAKSLTSMYELGKEHGYQLALRDQELAKLKQELKSITGEVLGSDKHTCNDKCDIRTLTHWHEPVVGKSYIVWNDFAEPTKLNLIEE